MERINAGLLQSPATLNTMNTTDIMKDQFFAPILFEIERRTNTGQAFCHAQSEIRFGHVS